MPSDDPPTHSLDAVEWLAHHGVASVWIGAFCPSVSAVLIIHLWFLHRRTPRPIRAPYELVRGLPLTFPFPPDPAAD